jgi:ABC-type uncharacterized transport system auxiliary subunit
MQRDTFCNLRLFPPLMGLLLWLILLLGGCAVHRTTSTNYYILEYYPHLEREELIQETPLPYTLQISPTTIPRTYNRKQLVVRHFGPKITYAERDLWSIKPGEAIPGLLEKRFNRYKLFRQVQRDFLDTPPDLELRTIVHNLEMMESQDNYYAHLNMDFVLTRRSDESQVVKYSTDVERPVSGRDPGNLSPPSMNCCFRKRIVSSYASLLFTTEQPTCLLIPLSTGLTPRHSKQQKNHSPKTWGAPRWACFFYRLFPEPKVNLSI